MNCPICNGDMWDNRERKLNPRQPDFKCKDKNCTGVIWPPRNKTPQTMAQYNKENGYDLPDQAEPTGYERAKMVRESLTSTSPEERSRRIERQHSQEMALRFIGCYSKFYDQVVPDDAENLKGWVKELTNWFQQDLEQS